MKKTKVLFIMHMPPPVHGAALVGQNIHDSIAINSHFECLYINASISPNIGAVGKFRFSKILHVISLFIKVLFTVVVRRPQICYYTAALGEGPGIFTNVAIVGILKLFNRKIVLHLHNKGCKRALTFGKIYHYAYSFIFRNTKVILLATQLYDDIKDYVDYSNVYICPNGIKNLKDEIKTIHNETPHILFLSNLIIEKGIFTLLDSLSELHKKGVKFLCNIVGNETIEISASRIKKEISSRNLDKQVSYLGKKYGEDKENCYKNADIFVFPTYYPGETFGLVLLEAMQHHLPCISTYEGGIPDVVIHNKTGILCNSNNVNELTDAIYSLVNNKGKRIAMGESGYERFISNFTLQHFETNLISILNSIIKDN